MMKASHCLPDCLPEPVRRDDRESGMIVIALLFAAVLPLVLLVGASTTTMNNRNKGLLYDIRQSRAMLAADSGIDEAIFLAANGNLGGKLPLNT